MAHPSAWKIEKLSGSLTRIVARTPKREHAATRHPTLPAIADPSVLSLSTPSVGGMSGITLDLSSSCRRGRGLWSHGGRQVRKIRAGISVVGRSKVSAHLDTTSAEGEEKIVGGILS